MLRSYDIQSSSFGPPENTGTSLISNNPSSINPQRLFIFPSPFSLALHYNLMLKISLCLSCSFGYKSGWVSWELTHFKTWYTWYTVKKIYFSMKVNENDFSSFITIHLFFFLNSNVCWNNRIYLWGCDLRACVISPSSKNKKNEGARLSHGNGA